MGEPEEDAEGHVVEDDLGQMLRKAEEVCKIEKESRDLKRMLEDYRISLYPDCKQGQKKVGYHIGIIAIEGIKWFVWQEIRVVAETYKNLLPEGNTLPETTYEAKKLFVL